VGSGFVEPSAYLSSVSAQADLFEFEARSLPAGMRYWEEAVSEAQERSLVRYIGQLPLQPFEFAGGFKGNRASSRSAGGTTTTDKHSSKHPQSPPNWTMSRRAAASLANHRPEDLGQALVTEYAPGAGIGWHRDKKMFGDIIGISLLAPCIFRLRLKKESSWDRISLQANPRSAYLLSGPSRTAWEHSIPP
jgi:alkylated DNA repair dioxygenase AlkB